MAIRGRAPASATNGSGPKRDESSDPLAGLTLQLLEFAPDAVVISGADGLIRFANKKAKEIFGYVDDELVGQPAEVLVPDGSKDIHPSHRADYMKSPTERPMGAGRQLTAQRKDGTEFPADVALSSLETSDGLLVSAAIRDVTERLEAEATGARLAAIVQSSRDAIIGKTTAGEITSWNSAATQMFGWSAAEAIGQQIEILIPPGDRDEEIALRERVVTGEWIEPYETRRLSKDGRVVMVELTSSSIKAPHGEIVGVSSIYRDISILKRIEAKYLGLLEAAPDGIIGVDQKGLIQLVTAKAERLFGYSSAELLGRPVETVVPEGAKMIQKGHSPDHTAHQEPGSMSGEKELRARRKDGSEFPVDIALSSVETEDGVIVSAAIRDITESLRASEERKNLEAQVRQSRLETVGQLAGGIAHDFNNILAGTMTYAKLVEEQLSEVESTMSSAAKQVLLNDVQQIIRGTERAASLTHQLLLFSRKEVVQPEVLDLNGVVTGMEDLLRRTIGEHIHITINLRDSLMAINMDRGHVEQILMNLIVNASDAMPSGGELVIETQAAEFDKEYAEKHKPLAAGKYVCLAVSDTGTGMSAEVVAQALEPFFTTKDRGDGSGLGLATISRIATDVKGHVSIYSEPDLGTTVKVYFPPTADAKATTPNKQQGSLEAVEGETVLLVEDEALVREPAARVLARSGYEVLAASGPDEALKMSKEFDDVIDVLLTDVVMPGMSGTELAEQLSTSRPDMCVLFMSGYSHEVIVQRGSGAQGIVLIEKPFTPEALLGKIRSVLDRSK